MHFCGDSRRMFLYEFLCSSFGRGNASEDNHHDRRNKGRSNSSCRDVRRARWRLGQYSADGQSESSGNGRSGVSDDGLDDMYCSGRLDGREKFNDKETWIPGEFCKNPLYSTVYTVFVQVANRTSRLREVAASFTLTSTRNRFCERSTSHNLVFPETGFEQPRVCCVTVSHEKNTRILSFVNPLMLDEKLFSNRRCKSTIRVQGGTPCWTT